MALGISFKGLANGFSFPFEKVTGASEAAAGVGAGTLYPVAMSLKHAFEIWHLWKTYQLRIAGDNGAGADDQTETYTRQRYNPDVGSSDADADKRDLIRDLSNADNAITGESENGYWSIYIESGSWGIMFEGDIFDSLTPESRIRYYNGSYYPKLEYGSSPAILAYEAFTDYSKLTSQDLTFNGTITMLDGTSYNVPIGINEGGETTTQTAWELTCTEYFGYGGKFNTSTGARL